MSLAYYNENDPEKVVALKALMDAGHIAPGEIDSGDIRDVDPTQLSRFAQCHFFAGIGLWSVAARAAGIPDNTRFWSGSCPCQPFSAAGAGEGVDDPRHLWPHWFWLIAQQQPRAIVGEQVASKDGLAWIELVSADMEGAAYAGGSLDLCSAGFGAPNIRQRLYMLWLADLESERCERERERSRLGRPGFEAGGGARELGEPEREGLERQRGHGDREAGWQPGSPRPTAEASDVSGMGDADQPSQENRELQRSGQFGGVGGDPRGRAVDDPRQRGGRSTVPHPLRGPTNGFWADADWLLCRDPDGPKLRPVRRGTFCLATGYPGRSAELRAYGDAINLQVATAFLEAIKPELMA